MYIDNRLGYTKMLCIFDWELRKIESTKEFVDTLDTVHTGPESIFLVQKLYLAIRCYGISSILDIDRI